MAKTKKRRRNNKTIQKTFLNMHMLGLVYMGVAALGYFGRGFLGIFVANMLRIFVGRLSTAFFLALFLYGVYLLLMGEDLKVSNKTPKIVGILMIIIGYLIFAEYQFSNDFGLEDGFVQTTIDGIQRAFLEQTATNDLGGGLIGAVMYTGTHFLVSGIGSLILSILVIAFGIVIMLGIPMDKILESIGSILVWFNTHIIRGLTKVGSDLITFVSHKAHKTTNVKTVEQNFEFTKDNDESSQPSDETPEIDEVIVDGTNGVERRTEPTIEIAADKKMTRTPKNQIEENNEVTGGFSNESKANPNYRLPASTLLTEIPETDQSSEYKSIKKNTKVLQDTLNSFGVNATVESVKMGPSVTEYELHPAVGVKVSKIVNLNDDLALALAAKDIRIEAPIPGKSLIGIEVPNKTISTVSFRDIIESQPSHPGRLLQVPIGRDVSGNLIEMNLVDMPHLLIAGSTGSGKSVMINVIIVGLLMNARPDQVKLILIDPKKVELGVYNDIPHLLTPVVTDARKASKALHKVVAEMQHRYDLFAEAHQRKFEEYNRYIDEQNAADGGNRPKLPYIVVVVDELADLMMVASNEVEDAITRLAQLARAAGIHMIIATQRPSVDVVTGLIKANVNSRIAFAVSSGIDSRTIIDSNGAEKLLGRGDMLYKPMDRNKPERVQGAFISDNDVKKIIEFVKAQQSAEYDEELDISDEELDDNTNTDLDEYYDEAVDLVVDLQKASTSMLQRKFRIGYNRAARLMDQLEETGVIGPQDGSKPRKVYRQKD